MPNLPPVSTSTAAWIAWLWTVLRWLAGGVVSVVTTWTAAALTVASAPHPPAWLAVIAVPICIYVIGARSVADTPASPGPVGAPTAHDPAAGPTVRP